MRPFVLILLVALAGFAAAACARSTDHSAATPTAPPTIASVSARQAVLTLADVPSGWQSDPLLPELTAVDPASLPANRCDYPNLSPGGAAPTESAQSDLLFGPTEELVNTTWRFSAADAARSSFEGFADAYDACRDDYVVASQTAFAGDQAGTGLSAKFSVEEITVPAPGADARAFRSTVAAFSGDVQVDGQIVDIVFLRSGALVCMLMHTSVSPDMTELRDAAAKLSEKMTGKR